MSPRGPLFWVLALLWALPLQLLFLAFVAALFGLPLHRIFWG